MANINEPSIPISYIVEFARAQSTMTRKQAFVNLLRFWAENGGDEEAVVRAILEIQGGQTISASCMPKDFMPRFRSEVIASQLIEIVRAIDRKISTREENWDWAHVMKVMIDEGIIMRITPNRFDQIISSMIPGKGRDNVRKSGDFTIARRVEPWHQWTKLSHLNPLEAQDRTICNMIAKEFEPVLTRVIVLDY